MEHSRFFTANATLARIAGEYFAVPSHNTRDELFSQLTAIKQNLGYDTVRLFDAAGVSLLAAGARHDQVCSPVQKGVAKALRTKETATSDIYRNEHTGSLEFSIFAPLIAAGPAANVTGVLVLSLDPGPLFALINSWPEPSASAESLLVQVEADRVVFIGELRHRQGTALTLEIPLSEKNILAVQAAQGRTGYITGTDYRGVPVVGVVQPVADGDWYLINKIDRTEVYAPVRQRAWTTVLATAAMLVILAVSLGAFRYERQRSFYRREYQAELERAALRKHYEYLTKYANDIIFLIDMATLRITETNERAEAAYGYTREELLAMKASELRPPERRDAMAEFLRSHQAEGGAIYETVHRRKDGTTFPIEVSGRIIHFEGKSYAQAIIRDITERRQAEDRFHKSHDFYLKLLDNFPNPSGEPAPTPKATTSIKPGLPTPAERSTRSSATAGPRAFIPTDYDRCLKTYRDAFGRQEPFFMEYRLYRHDGGTAGSPTMACPSMTSTTPLPAMSAPATTLPSAKKPKKRCADAWTWKTLSAAFRALYPRGRSQLGKEIDIALRTVSEIIGAERGALSLFSPDRTVIERRYEWFKPAFGPTDVTGISIPTLKWLNAKLKLDKIIHLPSVGAMPRSATAERRYFAHLEAAPLSASPW
jgi:PAS domain S-box-containing protein